ncbi:MAG TPA: hypothetical protein VG797_09990 [Phycisphaerales bacterium]|nr:hypothetical protein [Phycisphaerales bacterium]
MALIGCGLAAQAVSALTIVAGQGVSFKQVDFTFAGGGAAANTPYGLVVVDYAQLQAATGITSGYLNVVTSTGWRVFNLPIRPETGSGTSMFFDLPPSTGDVVAIVADAQVSDVPWISPELQTPSTFPVGNVPINAAGMSAPPASPPIGWVCGTGAQHGFNLNHATFPVPRNGFPNVQAAGNQCGPAALANSLQWLKQTFPQSGITFPQQNIPGESGDTPGSLVSALDEVILRDVNQFISGPEFREMKTKFIGQNGLADKITVKGYEIGGDGDFNGVHVDDQADQYSDIVSFLINELQDGEAIEAFVFYKDASGNTVQHAVNIIDGGYTGGRPWLTISNDAAQGDNARGTTAAEGGVFSSYVNSGNQITSLFGGDPNTPAQISYAFSQSPVLTPPARPGDADGDGSVGLSDIAKVIQAWGESVAPAGSGADLNGDGLVGIGDIAKVIANWGHMYK